MKNLVLMLAVLSIAWQAAAQVSINTDNSAPDPSAMLDVNSLNKGFLLPRMTYSQMNSIISPATGLMVFCTTTGHYYFNRGTPVDPQWVLSVALPFSATINSEDTLLSLTNTGFGVAGSFITRNSQSGSPALYAETNGPGWALTSFNTGSTNGFAGYFRNTHANNTWPAVQAKTAGSGPAFRANQNLGPGSGLDVYMTYPGSTAPGIAVYNWQLGNAAAFFLFNSANTSSVIHSESNGTGDVGFFQTNAASGANAAVKGRVTGAGGVGGAFEVWDPANPNNAIYANTSGTGTAGSFQVNNPGNAASALYAKTFGTGSTCFFETDNVSSTTPAVMATSNAAGPTISAQNTGPGNGSAGFFKISNPANTFPAVQAENLGPGPAFRAIQGTGPGLEISMYTGNSYIPAIECNHYGHGCLAFFQSNFYLNDVPVLHATTASVGGGAGVFYTRNVNNDSATLAARTTGLGSAGLFEIKNPQNGSPALFASTKGTGSAASFLINNPDNTSSVFHSESNGTGDVGFFQTNAASGANAAVKGRAIGEGGSGGAFEIWNSENPNAAMFAKTIGTSVAGHFEVDNPSSTSSSVYAISNSSGQTLFAKNVGTGNAGYFEIDNPSSTNPGVWVNSNAAAPAIGVQNTGTGNGMAGFFKVTNSSNTYPAVQAENAGTGNGMSIFMNNTSSVGLGLYINNFGLGSSANFSSRNPTATNAVLYAEAFGHNTALHGKSNYTYATIYARNTYSNSSYILGVYSEVNSSTYFGIGTNGKISSSGYYAPVQVSPQDSINMVAPLVLENEVHLSGSSKLVNGKALVSVDDKIKNIISSLKPVKVFVTLNDNCNGVFVSEKSPAGFTVTELNSGGSDASFDWLIIAARSKDGDPEKLEEIPPVPSYNKH